MNNCSKYDDQFFNTNEQFKKQFDGVHLPGYRISPTSGTRLVSIWAFRWCQRHGWKVHWSLDPSSPPLAQRPQATTNIHMQNGEQLLHYGIQSETCIHLRQPFTPIMDVKANLVTSPCRTCPRLSKWAKASTTASYISSSGLHPWMSDLFTDSRLSSSRVSSLQNMQWTIVQH